MLVFDPGDFGFNPSWEGDDVVVNHFKVDEDLRGQRVGSAVLETVKRVYYYEGADRLIVRMGGGDAAESFLEANGFTVTSREEIDSESPEGIPAVEGGAIVKGVCDYDR